MGSLPTGTVTFLFTDIEGSTTLLQRLGDRYADVLADCRRLLRTAVEEKGGQEVDTEGDAVFAAFPSARAALLAAVTAQQRILRHPWPDGAAVRVRMGLHTGEARVAEAGYVGMDVHRAARICAAARGGQILLSDTITALVTKDLPDGMSLRDLGEHRLKDLAHPHRLFQPLAPDLPTDFPPLRSLGAHPHNLPIPLTSFVGRAREIAEVKALLLQDRLVTLTGSGGAGKTRFALQMAADLVENYPDGVWLAELAPIADPALVAKTVASALGVPEQPGRDMTETLIDALRPKSLMLVLDNCEHLVAASRALVAAVLRACPQARILATSREGLGVPGEVLWRVPSLSVPQDIRQLPAIKDLVLHDAVRLFVDRAVATTPGFAVTIQNAPAVAQVCQRLDGIPLAIELAAARIKVLAVEQIAARLNDRFRLLTGGSPIALPRHQTLRAAMDWSYDLLSQKERAVLRRLSVFADGWPLEAAQIVCSGTRIKEHEILDLLTQLADKSLIVAEGRGAEVRYRLLETVRQYGTDKLKESREIADFQRRHRNWYLKLAEAAEPELRSAAQGAWLDRLEMEHDNFRAALEWSDAQPDGAEAEVRLVGALWGFWFYRGHWSEGRRRLEAALVRSKDVPASILPPAFIGAANLAWRQGDHKRAAELGEKGWTLCQELGDREHGAWLLNGLGITAMLQGDHQRASALFEESLLQARELGDKWLVSRTLHNLGILQMSRGNLERAATLEAESLALAREVGDRHRIAMALRHLGTVKLRQGESVQAAALLQEALSLAVEMGDKWVTIDCLLELAGVACAMGQFMRAARLYGGVEAFRSTLQLPISRYDKADYDGRLDRTRIELGEETFEKARAEGQTMTLERAIDYALQTSSDDLHG